MTSDMGRPGMPVRQPSFLAAALGLPRSGTGYDRGRLGIEARLGRARADDSDLLVASRQSVARAAFGAGAVFVRGQLMAFRVMCLGDVRAAGRRVRLVRPSARASAALHSDRALSAPSATPSRSAVHIAFLVV